MTSHAVMCSNTYDDERGSCFVPWCSCWCHRTPADLPATPRFVGLDGTKLPTGVISTPAMLTPPTAAETAAASDQAAQTLLDTAIAHSAQATSASAADIRTALAEILEVGVEPWLLRVIAQTMKSTTKERDDDLNPF